MKRPPFAGVSFKTLICSVAFQVYSGDVCHFGRRPLRGPGLALEPAQKSEVRALLSGFRTPRTNQLARTRGQERMVSIIIIMIIIINNKTAAAATTLKDNSIIYPREREQERKKESQKERKR